jgi:hypothetical protein
VKKPEDKNKYKRLGVLPGDVEMKPLSPRSTRSSNIEPEELDMEDMAWRK